jgi:hypothetical protein
MPYYISNQRDDCSGWATVKSDGSTIGCHPTKEEAVKHMVAVASATGEPAGGLWETRED